MVGMLKLVYRKLKKILLPDKQLVGYDFNISNPLGGNGERVDIQLNKGIAYDAMDIYQKNHWKRYEFATGILLNDEVCGDFACGTGYGSVLLAEKAKEVTGADINSHVINKIKERYNHIENVHFIEADLLNLSYEEYFDTIVSFETLEHFKELDIKRLLLFFSRALKPGGKLIFSTPYMQEDSEAATKAGFHQTYFIEEQKISTWLLQAGLSVESFNYQNYDTHIIEHNLKKKEFIIGVANKNV